MQEKHHWQIRGRVQGVSFRFFTREQAARLDLAGSVRNLSDGSVDVYVAGDEENVQALRQKLEDGPPMAKVESIDEVPLDDGERARLESASGFEIEL